MKRLFLFLVLLGSLIPLKTVYAQDDYVHLDFLQVDIQPEYDRPEVRVIYKITVAANVALPVQMKLHIPAVAGRPTNLAIRDVDDLLYPIGYSVKPDGQWLEISFNASSSQIELEYYSSNLNLTSRQRYYEYVWPGDYFIHLMSLRVQQPATATKMEIKPSIGTVWVPNVEAAQELEVATQIGSARSEEDGLMYYSILYSNIYNSPFRVGISYEKKDDSLSANLLPVKLMETPSVEPVFILLLKNLPWIPFVGGILFLALGSIVLLEGVRQRSPKLTQYINDQGEASHVVYCSHCGKRADLKKETYCPSCSRELPHY